MQVLNAGRSLIEKQIYDTEIGNETVFVSENLRVRWLMPARPDGSGHSGGDNS